MNFHGPKRFDSHWRLSTTKKVHKRLAKEGCLDMVSFPGLSHFLLHEPKRRRSGYEISLGARQSLWSCFNCTYRREDIEVSSPGMQKPHVMSCTRKLKVWSPIDMIARNFLIFWGELASAGDQAQGSFLAWVPSTPTTELYMVTS